MDRKHEKALHTIDDAELGTVAGATGGVISPNLGVNFADYGTAVAGSDNKTVGGKCNTATIDSFNVVALLGGLFPAKPA